MISNNFTKHDAIMSVQILQLAEVAEQRWDGASELIRGEQAETAPIKQ